MPPHPHEPLRVALLAYRGNPYSGGLGVYVRHLSRSLTAQGHRVTVFGGQPYPHLEAGVAFEPLPSLDLFRQPDPFRVPKLGELRDATDVVEFLLMCTATFPEPRTFSLRARRVLRARRHEFDVVHDNAGLGSGLLGIAKVLPVVATIHHALEIDRKVQLAAVTTLKEKISYRRWYAFVRMQARVARRMSRVITVSETSRDDIARSSGVRPDQIRVVANGVDASTFAPVAHVERVPGRIITTASADVPLKGLVFLLEALAKLRTERDAHLVVIGKPKPDSTIPGVIERFALDGAVRFVSGIDDRRLAEEYAHAEVAVVPSLYEGFSLPAVEAMACGVPLVATTGGALPEVVGRDGETGLLVPPRDPGALRSALLRALGDEDLRARLAAAGRARVLERFTWERAASATADVYREVIAEARPGRGR